MITQAAAARSRDLRARSGEEEKSLEKKWSPPQKSVKEVFVKSLEGKLLLFAFTAEDIVLDLRNRVAMACKVSVDQFVLVFQSRTLQSSVKVESTGVQRGHAFYMQGALKGRMQRQGLMGEWDCTQCGAMRVWPARTSCFRCGFKRDGSGYTASVLKSIRESQGHFVPQSVPIRDTGNGLGRTQRNQSSGCPTARASRPQPGPVNIKFKGRRNKQEEPLPVPDPLQTLTQVIQLLQNLPLDPSVKDYLRDSLQGHVAELIHEKQTERANEESGRVIKQNKYDLLMTNVQKNSQKIDGHVQRTATLDNELLDLHAALQLQKPITEPPPPEGPMPTVQ